MSGRWQLEASGEGRQIRKGGRRGKLELAKQREWDWSWEGDSDWDI